MAQATIKADQPSIAKTVCSRILDHLRHGLTEEGACGKAAIPFEEYQKYKNADPAFRREVELAQSASRANIEQMVIDKIMEGDARMALDYLKRRYPNQWAGHVKHDSKQSENEQSDQVIEVTLGPDPYYQRH
ncbi:MAG: hypothetical protein P9M14_13485 [Candidatus Alcyoniella australis]|nr:hypothetical protein [Candidatus Alcyoniella australis]